MLRLSPVRLAPAFANLPDSLMVAPPQGGWSDTLPLGFAACWSRLTEKQTRSRPSFRYAPTPGSQRFVAADVRPLILKANQQTRQKMAGGAATGGVGMKQCFRDRTQHTLSVWSLVPRSHLNSFRHDNSARAGPFGAELRSDNVELCAIPLLRCHTDCFRTGTVRCGQSVRQLAGITR
jgi:hypothetical protein